MADQGFVFISHSHKDIATVRRIRNKLESLGFEPLLFYLKCLSDEDEIEALLKREIDEREWFIYADSPNARASRWVQTEREYIESRTGKRIFTVDLSADVAEQLRHMEHIARQMKVFISYSRGSYPLAERIKAHLVAHDMQIVSDTDTEVGGSLFEDMGKRVSEASRDGFVLLMIAAPNTDSPYIEAEIRAALQSGGKIVPLYIGNGSLGGGLLSLIGDTAGIHLSADPTEEECEGVVAQMLSRVSYYESDFRDTLGFRGARSIHLPPLSRLDGMTFWSCEELQCVHIPASVVYIAPDTFADFPDILVRCAPDSYAARYCAAHGIRWEAE